MIKKYNGITLIALIITIVVLIILATVAINLSLGENGLFKKAQTAKEQYQNATQYEETEIAKATNEIDSYVDGNRGTVILTEEQYKNIIDRLNALESKGNTTELLTTAVNSSDGVTATTYDLLGNIEDYKYLVVYAASNGTYTCDTQFIEVPQVNYTQAEQFTMSNYANSSYFWRIGYYFSANNKLTINYDNATGWNRPKIYRVIGIK